MTEFNQEAEVFIDNFLSTPASDKEKRLELAQRTCELLIQQRNKIDEVRSLNNYHLGAFVASIKTDEIWRSFTVSEAWWEFEDFCKEVMDMSLQKANALERVWSRAKRAGMTPQEVETIGWTTADVILRFCEERKDVDILLKELEKYPTKGKFVETLKARREGEVNGNGSVPLFKTQYQWNEDEFHTIKNVLQQIAQAHGKELGISMSEKEAILLILVQWKQAVEEGARYGSQRL